MNIRGLTSLSRLLQRVMPGRGVSLAQRARLAGCAGQDWTVRGLGGWKCGSQLSWFHTAPASILQSNSDKSDEGRPILGYTPRAGESVDTKRARLLYQSR